MAEDFKKTWAKLAVKLGREDPRFAPFIEALGKPTFELREPPFVALCEAILSQQLNAKAASSIIAKFHATVPPLATPGKVLRFSKAQFRKAGVSPQKQTYLLALATAWCKRGWKDNWDALTDEELVKKLTGVKGVGVWTAQMYLIFSLGRHDVLPVHDYGIRKAIQQLYGLELIPTPKQLPELAVAWEGMASVACWYLWKALDRKLIVASAESTDSDLIARLTRPH